MSVLNALFFLPIVILLRFMLNNELLVKAVSWNSKQWHISGKSLTDLDYLKLTQLTDEDYQQFNETLDNLLIPRVPGSENHRKVRKYITNVMQSLEWKTEFDTFKAQTPHGLKPFTNIVATLNPSSCKRLVLACHYDSKYSKSGQFVGATDSAVPCAVIIEIVKSLDKYLKLHRDLVSSDTTLQLIFFDGEEAFVNWNSEDSLYGSRHLAHVWNKKKFLTTREETRLCGHLTDMDSEIDRMEVMVLLDLLGSMNPSFYSHFSNTHSLYSRLVNIEQKLNELNLMESHPPQSATKYFQTSQSWFGGIEDDHIPFETRGVPIVHVIPTPFPEVWHKDTDNRENIHHPTVNNLIKIFKVFVAQYLNLDIDQ